MDKDSEIVNGIVSTYQSIYEFKLGQESSEESILMKKLIRIYKSSNQVQDHQEVNFLSSCFSNTK